MADISLLFDVAGGGSLSGESGALISSQLSSIVNAINANPLKIKFQADQSSLDAMRSQVQEITKSLIASGATINIDKVTTGSGAGERAKQDASHYKDATRAVKEYYAMLMQLGKAKSDVTLTSEGWKSASGQWDELAAALNRTKTAFDLYTNAENQSKMSDEERVNFLRLLTTEAERYAVASETQANKEMAASERAAQKAAETAEKKAAAAEAAAAREQAAQEKAATAADAAEARKLEGKIAATQRYANAVTATMRSITDLRQAEDGTWVSDSGQYADKANQLNGLRAAFDGVTEAVNASNMSDDEKVAALNRVKAAEEQVNLAINNRKTVEVNANSVLKSYFASVLQGEKYLRDWSKAENSKNQISREAYRTLQNNVNKIKEVYAAYLRGEASAEDLANAIRDYDNAAKNANVTLGQTGDRTKTLGERIRNLASKFSTWFSITRVIMAAVRVIKQMISNVIEIDSAMTQLQIVTGATDAEMTQFLSEATGLAKELGKSISEIAGSIETFSRLGYNLPDASELAKYATILSNVASVDVGESTTGLTSIVKGFGFKNMDDVEHIADVLVEVGQKYAVSASELMVAYEKAGAALNATNTSFEKSAGLIAAANASVQNASTVGEFCAQCYGNIV